MSFFFNKPRVPDLWSVISLGTRNQPLAYSYLKSISPEFELGAQGNQLPCVTPRQLGCIDSMSQSHN